MQFALTLILWLSGGFGLLWLGSAILYPVWFDRYLRLNALTKSSWYSERWWSFPVGLLVAFSIGRVFYCAADAMLFIIPEAWGGVTEDGNWVAVKDVLQVAMAIFGTITLAPALEKAAARNASAQAEK